MKVLSKIYMVLIFALLYAPIIVLVLFSFNRSGSFTNYSEFSFYWYRELFRDSTALDALKKKRPAESPLDDGQDAQDDFTPEKAYIDDERKKALYSALDKLKPEYRQVIWLTYFENMSPEETAAVLKKSKNNVYTLLHRAKDSLKTKLEEEGFDKEDL